MLQQAGYEVVSCEGFADAIDSCNPEFDLIIMGHSIPQRDKRAIIAELRKHGCTAPVVSLLRHGEVPIAEAAHGIDPSPEYLLETVKMMLEEKRSAGRETNR